MVFSGNWAMRFFPACLAVALVLSAWAEPAFATIGPIEILLGASIVIMGGLAVSAFLSAPDLGGLKRNWPITLYVLSLLAAMVAGALSGAAPQAIVRAVGPYALIGVALLLLCHKRPALDHSVLMWGVLITGVVQALYLVGLYLSVNDRFDSEFQIILNRITLMDPRTTIPLSIAAIPVSIALMFSEKRIAMKIVLTAISILLVISSFTTIARTGIISAAAGLTLVLLLGLSRSVFRRGAAGIMDAVPSFSSLALAGAVLTLIPAFSILPKTIFIRQSIEVTNAPTELDPDLLKAAVEETAEPSSGTVGQLPYSPENAPSAEKTFQDLANNLGVDGAIKALDVYARKAADPSNKVSQGPSADAATNVAVKEVPSPVTSKDLKAKLLRSVIEQNGGSKLTLGSGRIEEEILPATRRFMDGTLQEKLFGIGAGETFTTQTGEARRYIHFYPLYLLVFHGLIGFGALVVMMTWICWGNLVRWWRDGDAHALATLGVAAAIYVNSLLFATHKLISFNLLVLAIVLVGRTTHEVSFFLKRSMRTVGKTSMATD